MSKRDYYETLGISKSASADEIKKAFRRLAVKHHPDKEGGNEAKFKEINEAYEVLGNGEKRQRYDQFGHAGVGGNGFGSGAGGAAYGPHGQSMNFDFGDIFGSFFGQGQQQSRTRRGQDVGVEVTLTFEEAIFGVEKDVSLHLQDTCNHCKGDGAEPGFDLKTCGTCRGSGQVNRSINTIFGAIQQTMTCDTCRGRGKTPEKACSVCRGQGTARQTQKLQIKIPAGIDDGAVIRLSGRGEAIQGGERGDLYVNIRVKPHKKFTREGELIISTEHVNIVTAALGGEAEIETVDGPITIKIPAGTQSGTDFKLSDHGVPRLKSGVRGAHIVTIQVDTPTKLTKRQKDLLKQFDEPGSKRFWG